MKNVVYIILILLSFVYGNLLSPGFNNECFTPNDLNGVCINIKNCPLIRSLLDNYRQNDSVISFVRKSRCEFEGKDLKVCCPLDNETFNISHSENHQTTYSNKAISIASSGYETVTSTKLPSQIHCGINNQTPTRILQTITDLGTWPWITAIGYKKLFENTATDYHWLCAGTLISDKFVLTAAHCTEIPNQIMYVVHLGDYDINPNIDDGAAPIDVPIEYVIPHEKYNKTDHTNDIALLKLERSVSFNKLIQPICLPILSSIRTSTLLKTLPYIAGWGFSKGNETKYTKLLEVITPVVNNEVCKRTLTNNRIVIDDRVLCLDLNEMYHHDICQGDSGGPLMLPGGKHQFYLVGVESYSFRCGKYNMSKGVYTRVTYFIDWILHTMENN